MSVETLRAEVAAAATGLAWDQWSQLGLSGYAPPHATTVAADPEALILLTLEVGRDEPRLFDELMDWWLLNGSFISVHRLRGLTDGGPDEDQLLAAALSWLTQHGPRKAPALSPAPATDLSPLFPRGGKLAAPFDKAFGAHGLGRTPLLPSGKSMPPDLLRPIAFSLRLRRLFGVGVRAEVMRALLTIDAPRLEIAVIAASAGFTVRNVRETIGSLVDSGVVLASSVGGSTKYTVDRARWASLLDLEPARMPQHAHWPQLLMVLRRLHRWLGDLSLQELSPYLLASDARSLGEELSPALRYAGVPLTLQPFAAGADYWAQFEATVREFLTYIADLGV